MTMLRVGVYILDGMKFDLFLRGGGSCEFWWPTTRLSDLKRPRCIVGADQEWHEVVKGLVHELFEASCMEHQCLFQRSTWLAGNDSGRHIIHATHAQFSEIADAVGDVLTYALPDVSGAYAKWGKRHKAKAGKRR